VDDDLEAILKAVGGDASMLGGMKIQPQKSNVPVAEF
jgi:hypothetical protein